MEYTLTKEDLDMCVKFAIDMYLKQKGSASRVTGQRRGLGVMLNDWIGGKANEIGITKILESLSPNKKLLLDFEIHKKPPEDPDIIKVVENGVERKPYLFVELKNYGENDRWVGLREAEYNMIKKEVNGDTGKAYLIFGELNDEAEEEKRLDLLGAFLKESIKDEYSKWFEEFADLGKIKVHIKFAFSLKELEENGVMFEPNKDYVYETDIFKEAKQKVDGLEEVEFDGDEIPRLDYYGYKYPEKIDSLKVEGRAKLYKKQNKKNTTYFIVGETDLNIKNKILGNYKLARGKVYKFNFKPAGRNPQVFREVLWIPARKATELFSGEERLLEIAKNI